jgi:hypothetical protein
MRLGNITESWSRIVQLLLLLLLLLHPLRRQTCTCAILTIDKFSTSFFSHFILGTLKVRQT